MKRAAVLLALAVCAGANADMERTQVAVTVYNQDFALVRDVRDLSLKKGVQEVRFTDVAARIDPTSVHLAALGSMKGFGVLEQNFEYDLLNPDKLLRKYIDRRIEVFTKDNQTFKGFLSSFSGEQIIVAENPSGPLYMVNRQNVRDIGFPQIPDGLITRPTLVWSLQSDRAAGCSVELTYMTSGMTWKSDYVLELAEKDDVFDLNGWVTVDNRSGAAYPDARLKLMAGDVRKVPEPQPRRADMLMVEKAAAGAGQQFAEKEFFEYHLYTLDRPTTLNDNQTKQIAFMSAARVPARKVYTYDGSGVRWYHYDNWQRAPVNKKVEVRLEFKNSAEIGMGMPLPKGTVRVYKKDTDGTSQFLGEDSIDHTPRDERISLLLGNAFDVVGDRKVKDHKKLANNIYQDTYEITIRNRKKEKATVQVVERLYGSWEITESSIPYRKKDATTVEFPVEVAPGQEITLTYTARYTF